MTEKKTKLLRRRIQNEKGLWNPLCYDCISAKIFDRAGADIIAISGYGISLSLLGLPDMGFISLSELSMVTRFVANSIETPVLADGDTGFGNALGVIRTTRELIRAGASAMLIEDQLAPKRCGHVAGKQVIPMEEAIGKYKAAVDVRNELDPDFVIVARTDARGALGGSLDDAIERANHYLSAGADVAFLEGIPSKDELITVVKNVDGPVLYNMVGISPLIDFSELKEIGVSIIGFGMAHFPATRSIWDYAHDIKKFGVKAQIDFLNSMKGHALEDDHAFAGFPEMKKLEEKYLPGEEVVRKYHDTLGYRP